MAQGKILLKGIAASGGVAKGKVKIVLTPSQCDKVKKGDILVARETTPEYISALLRAGAVVTDFGGRLSHPAIVAREMEIPGVVGVRNGTKVLRDNQVVVVNGNEGTVSEEGY